MLFYDHCNYTATGIDPSITVHWRLSPSVLATTLIEPQVNLAFLEVTGFLPIFPSRPRHTPSILVIADRKRSSIAISLPTRSLPTSQTTTKTIHGHTGTFSATKAMSLSGALVDDDRSIPLQPPQHPLRQSPVAGSIEPRAPARNQWSGSGSRATPLANPALSFPGLDLAIAVAFSLAYRGL